MSPLLVLLIRNAKLQNNSEIEESYPRNYTLFNSREYGWLQNGAKVFIYSNIQLGQEGF